MTSLLACVVLLPLTTVQASQESLFKQIFKTPTGNNGYEEYVMACDVIRETQVGLIVDATPESFAKAIQEFEAKPLANLSEEELQEFKLAKPSLARYQAAKKYQGFTILQLRKEAMEKAGRALDLLSRGNKKQV